MGRAVRINETGVVGTIRFAAMGAMNDTEVAWRVGIEDSAGAEHHVDLPPPGWGIPGSKLGPITFLD